MEGLRFTDLAVRAMADRPTIAASASVVYRGGEGEEYNLFGNTFERIEANAWEAVMRSKAPVLSFLSHDLKGIPLGSTAAGTMRLRTDATGLHYEIDLDESNPFHMSVLKSVQRGDIAGSSYCAYEDPKQVKYFREGDKVVRSVGSFARLIECGPNTLPAYKGTGRPNLRGDQREQVEREFALWLKQQEAQEKISKFRSTLHR